MSISWSAMRKVLEQENICDSLKGRIRYFVTRYEEAHDREGRMAILLDGEEIFRSDYYNYDRVRHQLFAEMSGYQTELEALNRGDFSHYAIYDAFHFYRNSGIDESLRSPDPVVRLLAILDRRVGKRRLLNLLPEIERQPEWLQFFYRLRMEADGIVALGK